jgi:hypothetical protein
MSQENLPHEEDTLDSLNPQDGNGSEDTSDDFKWLEGETETEVIARVNREVGKNYQSIGDIVKSIRESDAKFANEGRKQAPKNVPTPIQAAPQVGIADLEAMFFESKPEAERVKADLQAIARLNGTSVIQAWKSDDNKWVREKAAALESEERLRAANARKPLIPSGATTPLGNDYANMTDDEILNLPPQEAEKAFKAKSGR